MSSVPKTHYRKLVESDFLGQWDLPCGRDAVVIIESVTRFVPRQRKKVRDQQTGEMREEKLKRLDIGFRGQRKHFLAGPVSQKAIAGMYGVHVEDWIGKTIALYVDPTVRFGNEVTGGIRVRPKAPKSGATREQLDAPVDAAKSEQIERARSQAEAPREPGEEG